MQAEVVMTQAEYQVARERGRALAAQSMLHNPEAKQCMERKYGIMACRVQYPEAYGLKRKPVVVLP